MNHYINHPLIYPNKIEYREYQIAIANVAYERNTLVILPTALGKTVISALIAANLIYNYPEKRVLVMAPTRPLAMQHRSKFQDMIRLPNEEFALLTGKIPADYRAAVWNGNARLIFATPQVVRNDMLKNGLSLKSFGLLIFDECHRAVKEYAYTDIAKQYINESDYPLIIGLTASPGSNIERIRMVCESLFIEHVEYRTDYDDDVRPYIHPISVEIRKVDYPAQYQPLIDTIKAIFDSKVRLLRDKGYLKEGKITRRQLIELGNELAYMLELSIEEERGPILASLANQAAALTALHMLELIETQGEFTLRRFIERIMSNKHGIAKEKGFDKLIGLLDRSYGEHQKINLLKEIVKEQLRENRDSRILVFTQYRDTASHLVDELNNIDGIRAERFVGQASKENDRGLTQEQQASLIQDLMNGYINTLVATSIAEEGLDIPEVNIVIFYEPIPSEIRYIQRMGRTGRRGPGRVVILAAEGTSDAIYLSVSRMKVERMRYIAMRLNSLLRPVLRLRSRPIPTPMREEELLSIYSRIGDKPTEYIKTEREELSHISKIMSEAERVIYMKMLEYGSAGIDYNSLREELEGYGYSKGIINSVLNRLVKKYGVIIKKEERFAFPLKSVPGARIMSITIEKVMQGGAVVLIDDKWRARLTPENYNGPRELIKKGKSFSALCELYRDAGVLCLRVWQVVQA